MSRKGTEILKSKSRDIFGKKVGNLRKKGILPANIYGKNIKSKAIEIDLKEFENVFKTAGYTSLIDLGIENKKLPVMIHNVQKDPISELPIHIDFLQVDLKEKVLAKVPVELVGESPAEKQGLGTAVQYIDEVQVETLPGNVPSKFELDLSKLVEVDQSFHIKDISVDKDVEIKTDLEQVVVIIESIRKEEEKPVVETIAEGEEEKVEEVPQGGEAEKEEKEKSPEAQK